MRTIYTAFHPCKANLAIFGVSCNEEACNFHSFVPSCLRLKNNTSIDLENRIQFSGVPRPGDEIWSQNLPWVV